MDPRAALSKGYVSCIMPWATCYAEKKQVLNCVTVISTVFLSPGLQAYALLPLYLEMCNIFNKYWEGNVDDVSRATSEILTVDPVEQVRSQLLCMWTTHEG